MKNAFFGNNQSAVAPAPAEAQPDMEPVLRQEASVRDLESRLGAAQAAVSEFDSEYRAAAQREAMGEQPPGRAAEIRLRREDARVRVDGLELALQGARGKLGDLQADFQRALADQTRELHTAKFAGLVADAQAAQKAAVRHWEALAQDLGRVQAATDGLKAAEFTILQGGNVAAEIWAPLRTLRARALSGTRGVRSHDEIGVVAIMPAGE